MNKPDEHDVLWDPNLPANAELRHWQELLAPYAAQNRATLAHAPLAHPAQVVRRPRRALGALAIAASLLLALWAGHAYRLHWPEGQAWPLQGALDVRSLAQGERLQTAADQTVQLQVARIGQLQIAPGSALRLIESRSRRHRIELEHGRVHARIWAPPGQFGIHSGAMQVIDLGCEFVLERNIEGSGSLSVLSGWVHQHIGGQEQLVPAGHTLQFTADSVDTPLRIDAPLALRQALKALDQALRSADLAAHRDQLAAAVAAAARDEDQYMLISLLLREPGLASSPLYPRLAQALKMPATDAAHRAAWLQSDAAAMELWWQRLPSQPKRWWAHWRDAF